MRRQRLDDSGNALGPIPSRNGHAPSDPPAPPIGKRAPDGERIELHNLTLEELEQVNRRTMLYGWLSPHFGERFFYKQRFRR
jgi:hypothetical protein